MARREAIEDWRPAASWAALVRRAELLARLRAFFGERGFLEVETPLLSSEVVVERHLDPLSTVLFDDPRDPSRGQKLWLQTSPEAHMKRLMAAGGDAIFQVTRSFRGGERGERHNPEFTIVEWYRRGDALEEGMALADQMCQTLLGAPEARRITYGDAFREYAGIDPHRADDAALAAKAVALGLAMGDRRPSRDDLLNVLLAQCVEPHLGMRQPAVLYHYPASQAAIAEIAEGVGEDAGIAVAERFELYAGGVELANGYRELLDADELARRMDAANDLRHTDGKPPLPPAARMIAAQREGLPSCTGAALGFDRLAMLAQGASSLDRVIAFPIDRA